MQNNSISQISNFKHGDQIKGFYVCKSLQNKITRLGDEYLDLILEDSSGSIRAKVWSYVDEYRQKIEKGSHVAVKGKIITFNDDLEIDVLYINQIKNGLYDKYGFSEDLILKYSTKMLEKKFQHLLSYCDLTPNPYKKRAMKLLNDYKTQIIKIPSIDNKYNHSGGFINQLISVLNLNSKIYKLYSYDKELTTFGIIFKNIGLLEYFNIDDNFSISDKNKNSGYRLLGVNLVDKIFKIEKEEISFIKNTIITEYESNDLNINIINYLYELDGKINKQ